MRDVINDGRKAGLNLSTDHIILGLCRCISTANQRVIDVTVSNLSAGDAGLLLETAVDRLESRVGQRQVLVMWIKAVLLRHTAYLMSSGGKLYQPFLNCWLETKHQVCQRSYSQDADLEFHTFCHGRK